MMLHVHTPNPPIQIHMSLNKPKSLTPNPTIKMLSYSPRFQISTCLVNNVFGRSTGFEAKNHVAFTIWVVGKWNKACKLMDGEGGGGNGGEKSVLWE